jgi:hypothetical protein
MDKKVQENSIDLNEVINIILSFIKEKMTKVLLTTLVLSLVSLFLFDKEYESQFSAYPFSKKDATQNDIKSIAATYGLINNDEVSSFYIPDLVNSNIILDQMLNTKRESINNENLLSYWDLKEKILFKTKYLFKSLFIESADYDSYVFEQNINELKESIYISEEFSGLTRVTVITDNPHLSRELAVNLYNILNTFYNENNQDKALLTTKYLNKRIKDVKVDVVYSEKKLETFLEENRQTNSPDLVIKRGKLENEVNLKYATYNTLYQQLELELLDMEKVEKYLVLIDKPTVPSLPSSPDRLFVFFSIFGIMSIISITRSYLVPKYYQ